MTDGPGWQVRRSRPRVSLCLHRYVEKSGSLGEEQGVVEDTSVSGPEELGPGYLSVWRSFSSLYR